MMLKMLSLVNQEIRVINRALLVGLLHQVLKALLGQSF